MEKREKMTKTEKIKKLEEEKHKNYDKYVKSVLQSAKAEKKLKRTSTSSYFEGAERTCGNERLRECGIRIEDAKEKIDNHLCRALDPNKKGGDKVSYGGGCSQRVEDIIKDIDNHMKEAVQTKKRRSSKKDCDMTEKQVRHYLSERIWKHFCKWITGQTAPELPNGDMGYYRSDVERFADWCILKEPTYFD